MIRREAGGVSLIVPRPAALQRRAVPSLGRWTREDTYNRVERLCTAPGAISPWTLATQDGQDLDLDQKVAPAEPGLNGRAGRRRLLSQGSEPLGAGGLEVFVVPFDVAQIAARPGDIVPSGSVALEQPVQVEPRNRGWGIWKGRPGTDPPSLRTPFIFNTLWDFIRQLRSL